MTGIEHRAATEPDLPAIIDLWWEMQSGHEAYEPRFYGTRSRQVCRAGCESYFRRLLGDPDCLFLVAIHEGQVVGFIVAHLSKRPPPYAIDRRMVVEVTATRADHRRRGVFRGLLETAMVRAKAQGISLVSLSVDCDNPAMAAYLRSGFSPRQVTMTRWLDHPPP